jgi:hypothetical protein
VGDALKRATGDKGRVVALSLKDRSAVLLGCARARTDACYWYFRSLGTFVTSTYYRPGGQAHPWVAEFNRARPADRWFGKDWTRLLSEWDYARHSGPDDVAAEDTGWAQGRTFPHPLTGGLRQPGKSYYQALANSPFGNELLLDLAKRAIAGEGLGSRDVPDLLCVSFSSNDFIGHCWGPNSQEVLDVRLRSDRLLADLLNYLDSRVGRGGYVLAVTADHGVCPLPAVARSQGRDAGRVSPQVFTDQAETYLGQAFPGGDERGDWIQGTSDLWIYLNQGRARQAGLEPRHVEEMLSSWLARQPGVLRAYWRSQLLAGPFPDDPVGERVRRGFHPQRSGDVGVVLRPYYLVGTPLERGTTHGSPHGYDTHVPLLVYGPGIRPGVRTETVSPLMVAAILARGIRLPLPASGGSRLPAGLFE